MKLIIGLGNPGKEYAETRHNAGFMAVEAFAKLVEASWRKAAKHHAEIAKTDLESGPAILAKPQTFMNESGLAVQALASYYKVDPRKDLLVVQDELDFPAGKVAFAKKNSSGGHNGIASIIEALGTQDFARLRIGIGRPENRNIKSEHWVLQAMEAELTEKILETAPEAIGSWLEQGLEQAMNEWNR